MPAKNGLNWTGCWQFGQWDHKDPRAWLRRSIWRLAQSGGYDGPVTTSWYFGMRFNHHLLGDMSQCTYVDGRYEPNEMHAISKLIGPGMTVVDVGANAGVFTLEAAKLVGVQGAVHAFEPSPRDRERLLANVSLNALANVHLHAEALGRATGKAVLAVSGSDHPGHNTIGGVSYAAWNSSPRFLVESTPDKIFHNNDFIGRFPGVIAVSLDLRAASRMVCRLRSSTTS